MLCDNLCSQWRDLYTLHRKSRAARSFNDHDRLYIKRESLVNKSQGNERCYGLTIERFFLYFDLCESNSELLNLGYYLIRKSNMILLFVQQQRIVYKTCYVI
jgi:hypothetical protein